MISAPSDFIFGIHCLILGTSLLVTTSDKFSARTNSDNLEFKNYLSNYNLTINDIKKKIEIEVENEGFIVPIVTESTEVKVGDTIAVIVADKKNIKAAKSKYSKSRDAGKEESNEKYKI